MVFRGDLCGADAGDVYTGVVHGTAVTAGICVEVACLTCYRTVTKREIPSQICLNRSGKGFCYCSRDFCVFVYQGVISYATNAYIMI